MKLWAVTGQEAPVKYVVKCYKKKVYWNIFHFYHLDHLCLFVMSQRFYFPFIIFSSILFIFCLSILAYVRVAVYLGYCSI